MQEAPVQFPSPPIPECLLGATPAPAPPLWPQISFWPLLLFALPANWSPNNYKSLNHFQIGDQTPKLSSYEPRLNKNFSTLRMTQTPHDFSRESGFNRLNRLQSQDFSDSGWPKLPNLSMPFPIFAPTPTPNDLSHGIIGQTLLLKRQRVILGLKMDKQHMAARGFSELTTVNMVLTLSGIRSYFILKAAIKNKCQFWRVVHFKKPASNME